MKYIKTYKEVNSGLDMIGRIILEPGLSDEQLINLHASYKEDMFCSFCSV